MLALRSLLLSPLTWLWVATLGVVYGVQRRRAWIWLPACLLSLLALALATPRVANLLVGWIEARAQPRAADCDDVEAVVLLSGGLQRPPVDAADFAALTSDSLARLLGYLGSGEAGRLPLVIAGGGPFATKESELLAGLMVRMGAPAPLLETRSLTTLENARGVREMLPAQLRRIRLASTALHLPRAMVAFRAEGFVVCPWPLNSHYVPARGPWSWLPRSSALSKSEAAIYELVGEAWYRWKLRQPASSAAPTALGARVPSKSS